MTITDYNIKNERYGTAQSPGNRLMAVFRVPIKAGAFILVWTSKTALGPTLPVTQHSTTVVSLGVKQPKRDTDQLRPSNTKV